MTRTAAREIAVQLIFESLAQPGLEVQALETFFDGDYYETLKDVDALYADYPDETQLGYIRSLVTGVAQTREQLDGYIEKYARGWKLGRISRISVAILRCCMYEILYLPEVPNAAAINEAVELAKGYEEPETVSFINGILGSFIRGEIEDGPADADSNTAE